MTEKIPVERSIADGYGFAFRHFVSVLGTVWLPYLVLLIVSLALVWLITPNLAGMLEMQELDVAALTSLVRLAVLVGALAFITGCMVTVGIQRKALGLHPRIVWIYFSLGGQVWRMAAASLLAGIVVFLIALLTGIACMAIWFGADRLGSGAALIHVLDVCAGAAFIIYISVRLLFFLPAVVVMEGVLGLERSWQLGGHNFWRILVVAIAVVLPVALVFHLLSWAIFGPMAGLGMGQDLSAREMLRALLHNFGAVSPFAFLFEILERIVLLGVMNGAVASAYLSIAAGKADAAPAAADPPSP